MEHSFLGLRHDDADDGSDDANNDDVADNDDMTLLVMRTAIS